jgi:hypothetical protein
LAVGNKFDLLAQQQLQSCCGHLAESLKQLILEADGLQTNQSKRVSTNEPQKQAPSSSSPAPAPAVAAKVTEQTKLNEQIVIQIHQEAKSAALALNKVKQIATAGLEASLMVEAMRSAGETTTELLITARSLGLTAQAEA